MKKVLFLLFLFLFVMLGSKAQEAISTSGETNVTNTVTLSWTLGEIVTETGYRSEGESSLTQGFQQGKLTVTAIKEKENSNMNISVLPNPTSDYLNIATDEYKDLGYQVFNNQGKQLIKNILQGTDTKIDLISYPSGSYILIITKNNQELKSYQIIKK